MQEAQDAQNQEVVEEVQPQQSEVEPEAEAAPAEKAEEKAPQAKEEQLQFQKYMAEMNEKMRILELRLVFSQEAADAREKAAEEKAREALDKARKIAEDAKNQAEEAKENAKKAVEEAEESARKHKEAVEEKARLHEENKKAKKRGAPASVGSSQVSRSSSDIEELVLESDDDLSMPPSSPERETFDMGEDASALKEKYEKSLKLRKKRKEVKFQEKKILRKEISEAQVELTLLRPMLEKSKEELDLAKIRTQFAKEQWEEEKASYKQLCTERDAHIRGVREKQKARVAKMEQAHQLELEQFREQLRNRSRDFRAGLEKEMDEEEAKYANLKQKDGLVYVLEKAAEDDQEAFEQRASENLKKHVMFKDMQVRLIELNKRYLALSAQEQRLKAEAEKEEKDAGTWVDVVKNPPRAQIKKIPHKVPQFAPRAAYRRDDFVPSPSYITRAASIQGRCQVGQKCPKVMRGCLACHTDEEMVEALYKGIRPIGWTEEFEKNLRTEIKFWRENKNHNFPVPDEKKLQKWNKTEDTDLDFKNEQSRITELLDAIRIQKENRRYAEEKAKWHKDRGLPLPQEQTARPSAGKPAYGGLIGNPKVQHKRAKKGDK